jgi:hypothetical protein
MRAAWKLQGHDEYEELRLGWYDPAADDADFVAAAEDALRVAHGFTDVWVRGADNSAYSAGKKAADDAIGVELASYCSADFPMFLIAAKVITVYRGRVQEIDWPALAQERVEQQWDDKLTAALSVLGLTPIQTSPAWLLVSYWG